MSSSYEIPAFLTRITEKSDRVPKTIPATEILVLDLQGQPLFTLLLYGIHYREVIENPELAQQALRRLGHDPASLRISEANIMAARPYVRKYQPVVSRETRWGKPVGKEMW